MLGEKEGKRESRLNQSLHFIIQNFLFSSIPLSIIQSPEHIKLAIQAAMETIVLMKNDAGNNSPYLPIPNGVKQACVCPTYLKML